MADELNTPNHRYYQKQNHVKFAREDESRQWIYDSGIQRIDGTPLPSRWRLFLGAAGWYGATMSLAGLELRTSIGGANVLTAGMITASSTLGGTSVANLVDGNPATYWASTGTNNAWNEWLEFDFGTPTNIVEFMLKARSGTDNPRQTPLAGNFQYYENGAWVNAFDWHCTTAWTALEERAFSAPAEADDLSHRYWETLIIRSTTNATVGNVSAIAELAWRETAGGANVLTGETLTASDSTFGAAANANDGNAATYWASGSYSQMQWVRCDFGEGNEKNIIEVVTTARNDSSASQAPGMIAQRYSDDGTTWITKFLSLPQPLVYTAGQTKTFSAAPKVLNFYGDPNASYTGTSSDVTALPDLTGNGYNLTKYSDSTAFSITTLNDRNVVQLPLTANDQHFYNAALGPLVSPNNTTAFTVCGVVRYSSLAVDATPWGADNNSASFDVIQYDHRPAGSTRFYAAAPGPVTTAVTLTPTSGVDTTYAYVHVFDGAGKVKEWLNGAYIGEYTFAPTGTFGTPSSLSFGGVRTSATLGAGDVQGVLGAMGFASRALTDTEAANLAGYLAALYGA